MAQQGESSNLVQQQCFPVAMRVLVVDDDTICLKLMERLLHKCQYNVTTTNNGKEAFEILKENNNKFDIVISDVELPDIDGIKLLQHVAQVMNIPVIMVSAYDDAKRVMQCLGNGACDYFVKPARIEVIQNIWQHVVRRNEFETLKGSTSHAVDQKPTSNEISKGKSIEEN